MTAVGNPAPPTALGVHELYRKHFGPGRASVGRMIGGMVEVDSHGPWLTTADGGDYLDFGGYGVYLLGHRHPDVVAAVHRQLDRHPMASRVFQEPVTAAAAAALASVTPPGLDLVHFVNSGAEAVEAGLKLARAHGRTALVTTRNGFHGKTLGALSVTAKPVFQDQFRPLLPDVTEVAYGDLSELDTALSTVAGRGCFIVEPVQGEGGVVIPPAGYLRGAAELCRRHGALFVADEIQTGLGRLGAWWGVDAEDVVPDILLVGKILSGGVVPVAAMVATAAVYAPFARDPYVHTSTFAGSPLACAAAAAVVEVLRRDDLPGRAALLGARLLAGITAEVAKAGLAQRIQVRGRGLLIGLEFADPGGVGALFLNLLDRGVLANHSLNSSHVLRFTPPAILRDTEVDRFLAVLADALADL